MYKNVRWLHFNATSHSFPLSVQTADVAFLLHFGLVFFHTLQFLVHALQVGFHRQTMVVSEAVSVGYIRTGKRSGIWTQRAKAQCRPSRRDIRYFWNTPRPASPPRPLQTGHWDSVYQPLLPFFSQTSSGCRAVPQTGQAIVPMTGSSFHIDCSR